MTAAGTPCCGTTKNYIQQKEEAAAGADTSDAKVTSNVAFNFQWNQSEVTSSGFNQIEVNKDYALDITINPDETPDEDQKDDTNYDLNQSVKDPRHDGSDAYLDYTVTLVVKNEQAGPLTLADSMTLPTGVTAEYVEDSLQLSMENGNTTLRITWEDDNGERKITLGSAGSPIAAGTYSIRYTVKLKDVGETAVDGEVINNIRILDTPISDDAEESVKTDSLVITQSGRSVRLRTSLYRRGRYQTVYSRRRRADACRSGVRGLQKAQTRKEGTLKSLHPS